MKLLIIQTSPPHTASTLLVNAIYGIIPELFGKKIIGIWTPNFQKYFENIIVIKNHNTNIDELINKYNKEFKLVFICSERQEMNYLIDKKYKNYDNVVVFDFNELNETTSNTLTNIVDNIYNKVKNVLCDIELDKSQCIERIKLMNNKYEQIKNLNFSYIDNFFELHGSHRNRKPQETEIKPQETETKRKTKLKIKPETDPETETETKPKLIQRVKLFRRFKLVHKFKLYNM